MGKFTKQPWPTRDAATRAFSKTCVGNKGVSLAPQVGFRPEQGSDNIGSYWFYSNASNGFGQKCLLCPTDLSHVTVFLKAENLISGWFQRSGEQETSTIRLFPSRRIAWPRARASGGLS
jgi:hypothetical protein